MPVEEPVPLSTPKVLKSSTPKVVKSARKRRATSLPKRVSESSELTNAVSLLKVVT